MSKHPFIAILTLCIALIVTSCSVKKNTSRTRFWHGFTAHYNIYYNGAQAYIEGSMEKEKNNKDNFTERLPLYYVGNKDSRELGKSQFDIAITKSQKAIQLHSIKARPEWTKNRRKTQKDIEWLSRKEYNPFLWKAWMLMGRSQFHKGEFDEAAATFSYMARLYQTQPAIYGKARAWLAKCYIENDWLYDAEDVIRNMQRDSIDWRAQKEWDYTLCDYYLHVDSLDLAATYLRKVIKHEMRSAQKAREYYLLGQIEAARGDKQAAYKAFKKVLGRHPSYELSFNARIAMTEVLAEGKSKAMINRLRRMAHNDNNKEYLDQIYYAIGNIYLAQKDTTAAIEAYEKGNKGATRSGIEKGVLLLHLGDLYWAKEKYSDAGRVYGEAIGLLDKDRPDYEQLSNRSKVLDELTPYTDAIELQDSLQRLAKMDESQRNKIIDHIIDELKKKEKEEAAAAAQAEVEARQQKYGTNNNVSTTTTTNRSTAWYFYNPQQVQQGKQTFQRQWGQRENVDDWQRYNKTVVSMEQSEDVDMENMTEEQRDSLRAAEELAEAEAARLDSAVNNPHKREYYLAQIPFTEEQVQASNEIIKDALFHAAIIFKDKLDNLTLSQRAFDRLQKDFPEFEPKDQVYYHRFLLHSRLGQPSVAAEYVERMKQECPESELTILISDPYYADNQRYGVHLEDSLYGATYDAFKADRFGEVYSNATLTEKRFPLGANRDRFLFIAGLTKLNDGDATTCLLNMERIVKDYPKSTVAEMAGMIINGVKAGKKLHGAKFDLSDLWNRRDVISTGADSIANREFSTERETEYMFIMAYAPDSLEENKLLFQMARFNFTSFLVRNFDLTIEESAGVHHMTVTGFRNFNEARQYAQMLLQQEGIRAVAGGKARPIIISKENLELIGTRFSYNDYDTFYAKNMASLPVLPSAQLYEPVRTDQALPQDNEQTKPALPDDEVAPGGAKPVEPKTEEELREEDSWMMLGTDSINGTIGDIMIVNDSISEITPEDEGVIDIMTDTLRQSGIVTEETPTENIVNTMSDDRQPAEATEDTPAENIVNTMSDDRQPAENNEGETVVEDVVPTQTEEQTVVEDAAPAMTEEGIIVVDDQQQAQPEAEAIVVDEQQQAQPEAEDIVVDEQQPISQDEEIIVVNEEDAAEPTDDVIVFDDDTSNNQSDNDNVDTIVIEDDKQSTDELEDEYYELDGF